MIEAAVQDAFAKHLIERGWEVKTDNDDHTDVIARRLLHRTDRLEVLGAHDLSPRLAQDGTQQHDALCAGAGVVTRHRRSSHRPQVYLTVVQDAGARRGRGPVQ